MNWHFMFPGSLLGSNMFLWQVRIASVVFAFHSKTYCSLGLNKPSVVETCMCYSGVGLHRNSHESQSKPG